MKIKAKRLLVFATVFGTVLGAFTGCGTSQESAQVDQELRIAIQPVVGFLPLYVMKDSDSLQRALTEKGYDVDVSFVEFESGPPENEAFASNQVDVGVMGNVPTISGIANGQKRSIIGIAYNGEETEAILVGADSEIKEVSQLAGKKIGLVVGSIAQNYISVLLENNGLQLSDVELINLSPGEQQQALETKAVDAVATWEPTISKLVEGGYRILADGTNIFLGENPIIARTDYVEANPEIVSIFLDEYKKAAQEITGDIPGYAQEYANQFLLETDIIEAALSHAKLPVDITEADVVDLQNTADFLYKEELVSKEVSISEYVISEIK